MWAQGQGWGWRRAFGSRWEGSFWKSYVVMMLSFWRAAVKGNALQERKNGVSDCADRPHAENPFDG
ncbi:hypothetical protein GCM10008938_31990 [Deinococcus roseus]|uniref:Uncharacterized protein n=1 Tax=Deinococcus roseus TaxID=392414 RepID=A0ABQ2D356_9DEIO|nr:hypothetical protein GCM10008938_31990 [Deinococcus roseus]